MESNVLQGLHRAARTIDFRLPLGEDQIEVCRRYIERQGWTLTCTYADRAIGGVSDRRPAYQQLLGRRGRISHLGPS